MCAQVWPMAEKAEKYSVRRISGRKQVRGRTYYLIEWKGFGVDDDSWEPDHNILDETLVSDFLAARDVTVNSDLALWQLRDRVAKTLLDRGAPFYGKKVDVPLAAQPELARVLLRRLAQPRRGPTLNVTQERRGGTLDLTLEVHGLEHMAEIVALGSSRPGKGCGTLRFAAGRVSNEELVCVHAPLIITATGPAPRCDGSYPMGVYSFNVELCAVKFNGKSGDPKFSKMGDKAYMKPEERREEVVAYAKKVLRKAGGQHELVEKGWPALPPGAWCLSDEVAMPAAKKAKM